jgi:hypothetical protein
MDEKYDFKELPQKQLVDYIIDVMTIRKMYNVELSAEIDINPTYISSLLDKKGRVWSKLTRRRIEFFLQRNLAILQDIHGK